MSDCRSLQQVAWDMGVIETNVRTYSKRIFVKMSVTQKTVLVGLTLKTVVTFVVMKESIDAEIQSTESG